MNSIDNIAVNRLTIFGIDIKNYSVVCDSGAPMGVLDAAESFKKYIYRATGVNVPSSEYDKSKNQIVIGLDCHDSDKCRSARTKVKHDGFAIVGEGNKLFVTANVYSGVAFGVYALLEDYVGVRFYSSSFTVIRAKDEMDIPKDVLLISNPKNTYRNIYWADVNEPNSKNLQFSLNLRDNTKDVELFNEPYWYVGGETICAHSIVDLAEIEHAVGLQPCLSDENVYQTVLKNAKKKLKENPKARILSISQNDSWAHQLGCQCDKCRAIDEREGSPMGSLLTFVNRIADEIKKEYPNDLI